MKRGYEEEELSSMGKAGPVTKDSAVVTGELRVTADLEEALDGGRGTCLQES